MTRRIAGALLIALALSLALFGVASAHAKLVSSDPAAGANLTAAPAKVTLKFSEEISDKATDSFFTVTDEKGAEVGKGTLDNTDVDHATLSGALNSGLGNGVYTVTWQTITPDDQGKSQGSFTFGVNKAPGAQPTAAAHSEEQPTAAATGAAQPTAAAHSHDESPSTLPKTGGSDVPLSGIFLAAAALLLVGGLALRRGTGRAK
ncbi:MAG TPA: copper resistance protein CopC [Kouleothrix sp.]|uniref:copper resistance CopC family protein n=1 Tax=Kouleothrix sp. TaxID=2779161 RepID=UPI002CD83E90|nr:copper resistance protein CopC [Kouleothrix sp.]